MACEASTPAEGDNSHPTVRRRTRGGELIHTHSIAYLLTHLSLLTGAGGGAIIPITPANRP